VIKNILRKYYVPSSDIFKETINGVVCGLLTAIYAVNTAAIVFAGPAQRYFPLGIALALLSTFFCNLIIGFFSELKTSLSIIQAKTAVILSLIISNIVVVLSNHNEDVVFSTIFVSIALVSIFTGLCIFLVAHFRLERFLQNIPYSVIGGFTAGLGWLLMTATFSILVGQKPTLENLSFLFTTDHLWLWVPSMGFAILLLVLNHCKVSSFSTPITILGSIILFYGVLYLSGSSIAEAQTKGFLFHFDYHDSYSFPLFNLDNTSWSAVFEMFKNTIVIVIIAVLTITLYISSMEIHTKSEISLNKELKVTGIANMISGFFGGMIGFLGLGVTTLNNVLQTKSRLPSLISALINLTILFLGLSVIQYLPKLVLGSLVFFIGLTFLQEWIYKAWFRLPKDDYVVVITILVVISSVGFLEGVGTGIFLACVLFILRYINVGIFKKEISGESYQSNVQRPLNHNRMLKEHGKQLLILKLQGFIFFGTANNMIKKIKNRINSKELPPLHTLVLNFRFVTDLDSTVMVVFEKLKQLGENNNFNILLTNVPAKSQKKLVSFNTFPDLDRAVEYYENKVLKEHNIDHNTSLSLQEMLLPIFEKEELITKFTGFLEEKTVAPGEYIFKFGEQADGLFIIGSGIMSAILPTEKEKSMRLRTVEAGTIIGEVGAYTKSTRTASVVAETRTTLYHLSEASFVKLKKQEPEMASSFHCFIAAVLAERLNYANFKIKNLLE
jgi:sulfate permease, SulP family